AHHLPALFLIYYISNQRLSLSLLFPFITPSPSHFSTLSLHDALPISLLLALPRTTLSPGRFLNGMKKNVVFKSRSSEANLSKSRSEEHTSELQSRGHLVCRLLLEKKKTLASSFRITLNHP